MDKTVYTDNFLKELEQRQQPIDTVQLQLTSLQLFMAGLGYVPHFPEINRVTGIYGFKKEVQEKDIKLPKFISFRDACRLHNGISMRVVNYKWCDLLTIKGWISFDRLQTALKMKLVERVYLQRKGKSVKVQQHYVKLVD